MSWCLETFSKYSPKLQRKLSLCKKHKILQISILFFFLFSFPSSSSEKFPAISDVVEQWCFLTASNNCVYVLSKYFWTIIGSRFFNFIVTNLDFLKCLGLYISHAFFTVFVYFVIWRLLLAHILFWWCMYLGMWAVFASRFWWGILKCICTSFFYKPYL